MILLLIKAFLKIVAFVMFCILSSYTIVTGKKKSGIKVDYVVTALFLFLVMEVL